MYEITKNIASKIIDFKDYEVTLSDKFAWDIVDIPDVMDYINKKYPDSVIIGAYLYNTHEESIIFRGDIWTNRIRDSSNDHIESFNQLNDYLKKYKENFQHKPERILVHLSFKNHEIDYMSDEKKLKKYEEEAALANLNGWELPEKPVLRTE